MFVYIPIKAVPILPRLHISRLHQLLGWKKPTKALDRDGSHHQNWVDPQKYTDLPTRRCACIYIHIYIYMYICIHIKLTYVYKNGEQ